MSCCAKTLLDRVGHDFTYHPPKPEQPELYNQIRSKAREYAEFLATHAPESRELSIALTKLQEAVFWANASVARNS